MHVRTGTAAAGGRAGGPPSQPVIAHQPAEPSAMARASITRICVSGSNSGPLQARGIAMPKTPASFIAAAIDCGIRRLASISSLAARICSAGPIAACRVGESSAAAVPAAWAIDKDLPDRAADELDSSGAKLSRLDVRGSRRAAQRNSQSGIQNILELR
jgi:hypothetical protein